MKTPIPSENTDLDDAVPDCDLEPGEDALYVVASPDAAAVARRIALSREEPLLIGRKVDRGGISIEDPRMSRVHARVGWDARCGAFRVADLDSANGVWAGGAKHRIVTLAPRTALRLGGTLFVFGSGDPMSQLAERVQRAAASPFTVLVRGETGTGKEHLAASLHAQSGREGPFVPVNCSAFARELLSAELFGHTRGAFSGATSERPGLFRAAQYGTLFLDEIGDMPLELQPALLRALQERCVRPVGSDRELPVDVRVVAATHRDLDALVQAGRFRADLEARLSQVELVVPPLRDRVYTLPLLVRTLAERLGIEVDVTIDAMVAMVEYAWPNNVRELESLLMRVRLFGTAPYRLDLAFLRREAPQMSITPPPRDGADRAAASEVPPGYARSELISALDRHAGRVSAVAQELATSRTQIYRWLKRWGIAVPRTKKP